VPTGADLPPHQGEVGVAHEPREYQQTAISAAKASLDAGKCPILAAPTGAGKTFMGVRIAQAAARRTLWVAHRRELIFQARDAVEEAGGDAGLVLAGEPENVAAPFQVASVQTLIRREAPPADLLVIDECHHARGATYLRLIAKYPRRLGLTATPFRLDGKGLRGAGFDDIIVSAYADDLCAAGTLHAPTVYAGASPDLGGVKVTAGEYNLAGLSERSNTVVLVGNVVETWKRLASGKRTVVFAVDVAHGASLCARFVENGIAAELVTGETPKPEREASIARLAAGITLVLVNCMVFTEGWDLPALEVAVVARPTASRNLHLQMLGRVMRACAGKDGAMVLDHAGNWKRHGKVTDRLVYDLDDKVKVKDAKAATQKECPECALVIPMAARKCPSCGHVFVGETRVVTETDGELAPIGADDTFDVRSERWLSYYAQAARIALRQTGVMFGKETEQRAHAIASSMYRERYGQYPLVVRGRLVDAGTATDEEWDRLRERWRKVGESKKWDAGKTAWFVRKCEIEARAKATSFLDAARREGIDVRREHGRTFLYPTDRSGS
jgi:DNA repair protein RadD